MIKISFRATLSLIAVLSAILLAIGLYDQSLANKKFREELAAHNDKIVEVESAYFEAKRNINETQLKVNELLSQRDAQITDLASRLKKEAYDKVKTNLEYNCNNGPPGFEYCLRIVNNSSFYISSITGNITTYSAGNKWETYRATKGFWNFAEASDEYGLKMGYVAPPISKGKSKGREVLITGFVSYYEFDAGPEERARAAAGTLRLLDGKNVALDSNVTLDVEIHFVEKPVASDEGGRRQYLALPIHFRDLAAQELDSNQHDKLYLVELRSELEKLGDDLAEREKILEDIKSMRPERVGTFAVFYGDN